MSYTLGSALVIEVAIILFFAFVFAVYKKRNPDAKILDESFIFVTIISSVATILNIIAVFLIQ